MTLEEQIEAIVARKAEELQAPLRKEIEILKRVVAKNGDRIDTKEACRISGIKQGRTLKKLFTYTQNGEGGNLTFSRVEIETWVANKQIGNAA